MEASVAREHIARYLGTVQSTSTYKPKLREIDITAEIAGGVVIEATVISYVQIGLCDNLEVTQPVTFTVRDSDGVVTVHTTHDWFSFAWKWFWTTGRETCLEAARSVVRKVLAEYDESKPAHLAALLLVLSYKFGPDPKLLAMVTGRPEAEIELFGARFRAASIWRNDSVDSDPWLAPWGAMAFFRDALVGAGETERRSIADEAKFQYRIQ
jgi:hypothetical protein